MTGYIDWREYFKHKLNPHNSIVRSNLYNINRFMLENSEPKYFDNDSFIIFLIGYDLYLYNLKTEELKRKDFYGYINKIKEIIIILDEYGEVMRFLPNGKIKTRQIDIKGVDVNYYDTNTKILDLSMDDSINIIYNKRNTQYNGQHYLENNVLWNMKTETIIRRNVDRIYNHYYITQDSKIYSYTSGFVGREIGRTRVVGNGDILNNNILYTKIGKIVVYDDFCREIDEFNGKFFSFEYYYNVLNIKKATNGKLRESVNLQIYDFNDNINRVFYIRRKIFIFGFNELLVLSPN